MSHFKYTAFNDVGETLRGETEADSLDMAKRALMNQGLFVSDIRETGGGIDLSSLKNFNLRELMDIEIMPARVDGETLVIFLRQFATLVGADVPLIKALDILIAQGGKQALIRILRDIKKHVNEGGTLSEALEAHPKTFSDLMVNMIHAGESTGTLGNVLEELATMMEERRALISDVRGALTYPLFVLFAGVAVVIYLLHSVVPNITDMYTQSDQTLPAATQFLMSLSSGVGTYGLMLAVLIFCMSGLIMILNNRIKNMRLFWHKLALGMPMFGTMGKRLAHARFSGTLAALTSSGVPLITALGISKAITPFLPYRNALEDVTKEVSEGGTLAEALEKTEVFNPFLVNMAGVGESTGKLDKMLSRVADFTSSELRAQIKTQMALLQPILLLLVGGMVAFIMMAVLMPLFDMNSGMGL
jgi:type II secretory pathway component PulF